MRLMALTAAHPAARWLDAGEVFGPGIGTSCAAPSGDLGMTRHAYPTSAMIGDYLRAAAGFVPTAAILAIAPVGAVAGDDTGRPRGAVFAIRRPHRAAPRKPNRDERSRVVRRGAARRRDPLGSSSTRIKLAYYSTRRDRRDGWMQLELRAGSSRIRLDSRIDGFAELVGRAARAAAARGIELSPATAANLQALGIGSFGLPGPAGSDNLMRAIGGGA